MGCVLCGNDPSSGRRVRYEKLLRLEAALLFLAEEEEWLFVPFC